MDARGRTEEVAAGAALDGRLPGGVTGARIVARWSIWLRECGAVPRYLIERDFGLVGEEEMQEVAARSKATWIEHFPDIR